MQSGALCSEVYENLVYIEGNMLMKKILLYEEDSELLHTLSGLLEECMTGIEIITAMDCVTVKKMIKMNAIQVFLLDLECYQEKNDKSIIDLGRYIRSLPQYQYTPIIFFDSACRYIKTAVNELHCQSYILKPFSKEEIMGAISYISKIPIKNKKYITLYDIDGVYYKIDEKDICFIEAMGKKMKFYVFLNEQSKIENIVTNRYRLLELRERLSSEFIQSHRKYIVNLSYVSNYDKTMCMAQVAGYSLPIGRSFKVDFEQALQWRI